MSENVVKCSDSTRICVDQRVALFERDLFLFTIIVEAGSSQRTRPKRHESDMAIEINPQK